MESTLSVRKEEAHKRDLTLLYMMYKYRALTTDQVAKIRKLGKWYVYDKLQDLRNKGFIYSETIKGNYIPNQRRQGSYHRISGKGISLLKKNGFRCDNTTDELRVSKYRLPYLLTATDLYLSLEESGWKYLDSRAVKKYYGLNRNDLLQGALISPTGKEYALYILFKKVQKNTLYRIKREIKRSRFNDVLVTTRGSDSFQAVYNSFTDKNNKLIKGGSIKILPFRFAQSYLRLSSDVPEFHKQLINAMHIDILSDQPSKNDFEANVFFDYLIRYQDEEMYLMDLLGNDLMKIAELSRYRKEDYERIGKKVLVLTSSVGNISKYQKELLGEPEQIKYCEVDPQKIVMFSSQLKNSDI